MHLSVPAGIALVLIVAYLVFIQRFGVNVPFWDEWNLGKLVLRHSKGELSLFELLTVKHNEHLMGGAFALMLTFHALSDYNSKAILLLSAALQVAAIGLFLALGWRLLPGGRRRGWYALLISLPLVSLAPAWNILWGFQTAWYLITFLLLASLWCLSRAVTPGRSSGLSLIVLGSFTAVIASFSSVQGLAVWPAGAAYLYFALGGGRLALYDSRIVLWLVFALSTAALYVWVSSLTPTTHSTTTGVAALIAADPLALVRFTLAMLSTVWGDKLGAWATIAGAPIGLLIASGLLAALVARDRAELALPIALMTFGIMFALMVGIGRVRLGQAAAIESRYSGYLLLAAAGSVLALLHLTTNMASESRATAVRALLVALVVAPFVSAAISGLETGRQWREDRGIGAQILLDAENQARFKIERTLCWDAEIVLKQVPYLRSQALSTFAGGINAIPRAAARYAAPPATFLALFDRWPEERAALQRLWDVYVVGPDLRRAFPVDSASMPADLVGWAAGAARGEHYLAPRLAEFASQYERIRERLSHGPGAAS